METASRLNGTVGARLLFGFLLIMQSLFLILCLSVIFDKVQSKQYFTSTNQQDAKEIPRIPPVPGLGICFKKGINALKTKGGPDPFQNKSHFLRFKKKKKTGEGNRDDSALCSA